MTLAAPVAAIVGGNAIQIEAAPWAAFVINTAGSPHNQCGGTVIDTLHIVTAAHCLYGLGSGSLATPDQLSVRAGLTMIGPLGAGTGMEQDRGVASLRIHPSYLNGDIESPGDIAVITLSQPLDLSGPDVQAAALPAPNAAYPANKTLTLTGYGQEVQGTDPTEQLESTTVTVEPQGVCGQLSEFRRLMYFNNGNEFCATSPASSGCGGDSGGGLIAEGTTPTLIGVYTAGTPTCALGSPELSVSAWTPENRSFILGNDKPPLAPRPVYPSTGWSLTWSHPLTVGGTLTCSTSAWPTAVQTSYTFSTTTGTTLQHGVRGTYRPSTSTVGKSVVCTVTVRNAGGSTVETTLSSPRVKPAG
jgi:hypothetical protein